VFGSELQVGIAYALLAGALWGIGPLLLKRALKYTNVSTATLVEQNVSVFLIIGLAIYYGEIGQIDFTSRSFWAFFLAGAVGASFGKVFYYKGIDKVGASKATSVKNSSPFLTAILAVLFLGEAMSWFLAMGVTLIALGIAILTQTKESGERSVDRLQYFLYPIIAALCFGVNPIFKKFGIDAAGLPVLGTMITQVTALGFMLLFSRESGCRSSGSRCRPRHCSCARCRESPRVWVHCLRFLRSSTDQPLSYSRSGVSRRWSRSLWRASLCAE